MNDNWSEILDEVLEMDDGLSEWELEFAESLDEQRSAFHCETFEPTDSQYDKLEEIWMKVMG